MDQALRDAKRYRGFVLTPIGHQKLQNCIQALELKTGVHQGARAIAERVQLIAPAGIHPMTVRKLLRGQQGVDKRSIHQVFAALQILLEVGDYAHASLDSSVIVEFPERPEPVRRRQVLGQDPATFPSPDFYGRVEERSQLRQQILVEQSRLIAVFGAAGMGKTTLVQQLIGEVEPAFDCFVWKSLHHAPPIAETLTDLLQSMRGQLGNDMPLPTTSEGVMTGLLRQLQQHHCLLVLDGIEAILGNRPLAGYYRTGYEQYGEVFRAIAESCHRSCLILTSQEKPRGFKRLENQYVHSVQLSGLPIAASQQLLQSQGILTHWPPDWHQIVDYYAGNPLFLKLVAAHIADYFEGDVAAYRREASHERWLFQDVRDLLAQQFSRTTAPERLVMQHLAITGDWVALSTLQTELNSVISSQALLDVLDSLDRRSLLQKSGIAFRISAAMTEFMQHYGD